MNNRLYTASLRYDRHVVYLHVHFGHADFGDDKFHLYSYAVQHDRSMFYLMVEPRMTQKEASSFYEPKETLTTLDGRLWHAPQDSFEWHCRGGGGGGIANLVFFIPLDDAKMKNEFISMATNKKD